MSAILLPCGPRATNAEFSHKEMRPWTDCCRAGLTLLYERAVRAGAIEKAPDFTVV